MNDNEKYLELEKLISLAEEVSNNLTRLDESRNNFFLAVISFVVIIFTMLFAVIYFDMKYRLLDTTYFILLPVTIILFSLYIVTFSLRYTKMISDIENESEILNSLLDMIHSYKEAIYLELTYTNLALINMKLSRISFSLSEKYKRPRRSERPMFRMIIYDDKLRLYDLTAPTSDDTKLTNDIYKMQEAGMKVRCQSEKLNVDEVELKKKMIDMGYSFEAGLYQALVLKYKDKEGWKL